MTSPDRTVLIPPAAAGGNRLHKAPGFAVGVTEAMIQTLVHTFYDRVRAEPVLGPIFIAHIADWDAHLAKLCDFWSSVMLMTGRFKGAPMVVHARMAEIEPAHFTRWLALFETTAREVCPPAAADLFASKARTIGKSLQIGIAMTRGELAPGD